MIKVSTSTLGNENFPLCLFNDGNKQPQRYVKGYIEEKLNEKIKEYASTSDINLQIRLYHAGRVSSHNVGDDNEIYVFNNYTDNKYAWNCGEERNTQFGSAYQPVNKGKQYLDETGEVIMEHVRLEEGGMNDKSNMLFIYPDMLSTQQGLNHIIDTLNNIIYEGWKKQNISYDWNNKEDEAKQMLLESFESKVSGEIERRKRDIESSQRTIDNYARQLREVHDKMVEDRRYIQNNDANLEEVMTKVKDDLDLILNIDNVDEVKIVKDKIKIKTKPIVIHDDRADEIYQGGSYTLIINLTDGGITFDCDVRRRSYWSREDMHPHINNNGNACFGNIEPTLIELMSQNEFYALTLSLIDFISSTNTSDPAGECIKYWDRINGEGEVIKEGLSPDKDYSDDEDRDYDWFCDDCGDGYYEDDEDQWVYENTWTNDDGDEEVDEDTGRRVCRYCLENNYHYNDIVEEYIRD